MSCILAFCVILSSPSFPCHLFFIHKLLKLQNCEGGAFTNFVIKAIYAMWNNNWVQVLFRIA